MSLDQPAVLILIVLIIGMVVGLSAWFSAQRRKALSQWAGTHDLWFDPRHDYDVPIRYSAFKCFLKGDNRYAYNIMEGKFQNRPFLGFDYHYETHSSDSKGNRQTNHHHFSAVILQSDVPLKPLFIRHEGLFDKVTEFLGFDDINFESAEFSRKFYVKAPDKRWAYDVLHARTIEFLLREPQFTLQFDFNSVIAYRSTKFRPEDFEAAATVVHGILSRLPEYLVKQQLAGQSPQPKEASPPCPPPLQPLP